MTAEERIAKAMSLEPETLHVWSVIVRHDDLRDLLSLIASLRAANAEQAAVIERLTHADRGVASDGSGLSAAIVSPRLCSRTACAGDVADFVRDMDEMGGVK